MNWNKALEIMGKGEVVKSNVSFTQYQLDLNGQLLAEGNLVRTGYVTDEEKQGNFEIAKLVYPNSSDNDIAEFLDDNYKYALFIDKYKKQKEENIIRFRIIKGSRNI